MDYMEKPTIDGLGDRLLRMSKLLMESTSVPVASKDGRWSAVLITPGKGSSGTWTESVLRERGPKVLRKGAKSFVTHNRTENGEPDPFRMWGFLAEDPVYKEGVGLVGEIEVLPSWRDRVDEVAPHTALSVYLMGESDENGVITDLYDDVQNGVDLVVYPGRENSGLVEKLYESAIADSQKKPSAASAQEIRESKGTKMDEETKAAFAALTTLISGLVETKQESAKVEVEASVVSEAVKSGVEAFAERSKLVAEADILESQKAALLDRAAHGEDITAGLAEAVKFAAEAKETYSKESYQESGRIGESAKFESATELGKAFG